MKFIHFLGYVFAFLLSQSYISVNAASISKPRTNESTTDSISARTRDNYTRLERRGLSFPGDVNLDQIQVDRLRLGWAGATAMSLNARRFIQSNSPIFTKYFRDEDRPFVDSVFGRMTPPPGPPGAPGETPFGNKLFEEDCQLWGGPLRPPCYPVCDDENNVDMKTFTDNEDICPDLPIHALNSIIVICPSIFLGNAETPRLMLNSELDCDIMFPAGTPVVPKMYTLSSRFIREWTRWTYLVNPGLVNPDRTVRPGQIVELWGSADDRPINPRGAWNTQLIRQNKEPVMNADNYAWFATEAYWSFFCGITANTMEVPRLYEPPAVPPIEDQ